MGFCLQEHEVPGPGPMGPSYAGAVALLSLSCCPIILWCGLIACLTSQVVHDILNETKEELDFRDRVNDMSKGIKAFNQQ